MWWVLVSRSDISRISSFKIHKLCLNTTQAIHNGLFGHAWIECEPNNPRNMFANLTSSNTQLSTKMQVLNSKVKDTQNRPT